MYLHQVEVGHMAVFAYIVGDPESGEGLAIDPAGDVDRIIKTAKENGIGITVADEGPGVTPEELPHLFDTFFRGKKAAAGGVGLGLSICKGIVEAHGGRVAAYVNRKGGLSISIILPNSARDSAGDAGAVRTEST